MQNQITIIGAGLSGLALAYFLKQRNIEATIIEARNRIGGRIQTTNHSLEEPSKAPIDLGPAWIWQQNIAILDLIKELDLKIFKQQVQGHALFEAMSSNPVQHLPIPSNQEPSFRIAGGTASITNKLYSLLDDSKIHCGESVKEIIFEKDIIILKTKNHQEQINTFETDIVISTIPPRVFHDQVKCYTPFPKETEEILSTTHTWMEGSMKFGLNYKEAFWNTENLGGTCFSNVGPFSELYDHSDFENKKFALAGFLNPSISYRPKEERILIIEKQLVKFFGEQALHYTEYHEKIWNEKEIMAANEGYIAPHQNNGAEELRVHYFNNRFYFGGSESAAEFPGYMEGAIRRAKEIFESLTKT